jgi:hypothetical protein
VSGAFFCIVVALTALACRFEGNTLSFDGQEFNKDTNTNFKGQAGTPYKLQARLPLCSLFCH